jgi:N-acetylated-alpha-linked acidic dipeptidase
VFWSCRCVGLSIWLAYTNPDSASGTAVMLEVVTILGKLRGAGWRPVRSIVVGSWDAEEYNMVGSTEFVEDNIDDLRRDGVAYLNVDVGVSGPNFGASASPLFKRPLMRVLSRVADPNTNKTLKTIWQEKNQEVEGLGSGSDFVAFQDLAGVSSIDFGFSGEGFPYHSCYETYEWMDRYGDPDFKYHKLLAEIWVLLVLEFSQENMLPFGMVDYASSVKTFIDKLAEDTANLYPQAHQKSGGSALDFTSLYDAAKTFEVAARKIDDWETWWYGEILGTGPADGDALGNANGMYESGALGHARHRHNAKVSDFESNLLDLPREGNEKKDREHEGALRDVYGIPGREQFKHVIFGPQMWSGYEEAYFPFIRDALERGDWEEAKIMVERTARVLRLAGEKLAED